MTRYRASQSAVETPAAPKKYRHILVPLDGTPFAETAVRPAAALATRAGAALHLASVPGRDVTKVVPLEPSPADGIGEAVRESRELEQLLKDTADLVRREWGCTVTVQVLGSPPPADSMKAHALALDADLIVAATHSRGPVARSVLGSTSMQLVRDATCPVLLIPSDEAGPRAGDVPLQGEVREVMVALEPDADLDAPQLEHALTLASFWDARLLLVQAVLHTPIPSGGPGAWPTTGLVPTLAADEERLEQARNRLQAMAARLGERGFDVETDIVRGTSAAHAIFDRVRSSESVDLLVVGRHDKGFFEKLWKGSDSERLLGWIRSAGLMICPLEEDTDGTVAVD